MVNDQDVRGKLCARHIWPSLAVPLARAVMWRRLRQLSRRKALYNSVIDASEIERYQVRRFNEIWGGACKRYSFYKRWREENDLPHRIERTSRIAEFPLLRKTDLQQWEDEIFFETGPCKKITTGGSTGQPTTVPVSDEDRDVIWSNLYIGRSWWNIEPFAPIVQIWGHSHRLGEGLRGRYVSTRRRVRDAVIGTTRLNAYQLTHENSRLYFDEIAARPGSVVVAYASAMQKILDHLQESQQDGRAAQVRAVILTSEQIDPIDITRIEDLLGVCPIIEYGLSETGVVSYSRGRTNNIAVLWDSSLCTVDGGGNLAVTTLSDRLFPLINYDTGDMVELPAVCAAGGSVLSFSRIIGRANDVLDLPLLDGRAAEAHHLLFSHVVRHLPYVRSYVVQQEGRRIVFHLETPFDVDPAKYRYDIISGIRRIFPDIEAGSINVARLSRAEKTAAGKHRWVIKDAEAGASVSA